MPRKDLTLAQKIAILDQLKNQPSGISQREMAENVGVPRATLSRLIRNERTLQEKWAVCRQSKGSLRKRNREGKNPEVDRAVKVWLSAETERGVNITGRMLKLKAKELAQKLGCNEFRATDGWLSRWKSRYNINFKKVHSDEETADVSNAEEYTPPYPQHFLIQVFELYKKNRCIWDSKAPTYRSREAKKKAYEDIVEMFKEVDSNATEETVKRTFQYFQRGYSREYKLVSTLPRTYTPRLWYYHHLKFLDDQLLEGDDEVINDVKTEMPDSPEQHYKSLLFKAEDTIVEEHEFQPIEQVLISNDHIHSTSEMPELRKEGSVNERIESLLLRISEKLDKPNSGERFKDRYDLFGETIAMKLRNIEAPTRIVAEKVINDVLYQAEIGELSGNSRVVLVNESHNNKKARPDCNDKKNLNL